MSGAAKVASSIVQSAKTVAKSDAAKTSAKIVGLSAATGGGAYLALSGVGAGIEAVGDGIGDALAKTGLGNINPISVPDMIDNGSANRNVTSANGNTPATQTTTTTSSISIGTVILIALGILAVYLIFTKAVPKIKKTIRKTRR